jgi:Fuc2NAc and GlcNAc transferase
MVNWRLSLLVLVTSIVITGLLRSLALHRKLLDTPVPRSAHSSPTPVGGGLSIVLLFYGVLLYLYIQGAIPFHEFMALLAGLLIACMGFVDDISHLDIRMRLPVQFGVAIWAVWWLGGTVSIPIANWTLDIPWLLVLLSILALVWLINLYNFMDGIDGLAGSEACTVNLIVCLFVINSGDQLLVSLTSILLAASAGFLCWNWSPAKIFMGDVGSAFIGFSFGMLALLSMMHGSMNLWAWLLLLGVFVVDATVTLLRRVVGGHKWYEGHNIHAYQHAARLYGSHHRVTLAIILINFCWLGPLAWFAVRLPEWGVFLTLAGMLPLLLLALWFDAGISQNGKVPLE